MNESFDENESLVISYKNLRIAVGVVGMFLPLVLVLGRMIQGEAGLLNSISGYYYSGMRDFFVGGLWAIGIFLLSYRGYERKDDIAGTFACLAAIGVAVFPTTRGLTATPQETAIGYWHLFFAACFFALMAYFCLRLFTKSKSTPDNQTSQKRIRNKVYIVCGWIIVACIVLIFLLIFVPTTSPIRAIKPVFWLETIAVEVFGFAWLVKGEFFFGDRTKRP